MSITRLQQARQMYAMGQRVAKTLDGSRPGYRGSDYGDQARGTGAYSGGDSSPAAGGTQGGGTGSGNQNTGSGSNDDRSSDTQQYNHYEAIEQNTGVKNPLRPSGVQPGFIKPENSVNLGLNLRPYEQQRVDFLNAPYKPVNIPSFIPGGMFINTVGNFLGNIGHKKNAQFFADNVAGKYNYGYDPTKIGSYEDAYQRYMKDRMAGEVGAYGNKEQGQNALSGQGGGGIMDVYPGDGEGGSALPDDTDDTNEDGQLILRYLHDKPKEVVNLQAMGVKDTDEMLQVMLDRAKNLYTT